MYAPQPLDLRGDRGGNKDKAKKKPKKDKPEKVIQRRETAVPASNITRAPARVTGDGGDSGEK